ncbi:MAG: hypothetical protein ACI4UW_02190, partial [Muribaculaceae bacterium]
MITAIEKYLKVLLAALAFAPGAMTATASTTDSLLLVLDEIIANKATYEGQKRSSIERHLYKLKNAVDEQALFDEYSTLFERYRKYRLDSALYYARKKLEMARKI